MPDRPHAPPPHTPRAGGFAMPPEWGPHARTWMAWPCRAELWGDGLAAARAATAAVARAIHRFEPVTVAARPTDVDAAGALLGSSIDVWPIELDDSWARDIGPSFVRDRTGRIAGCDWRFNAWGNKFEPFDADAAFARRLLEFLEIERFEAPFVLEGGSIHVDGDGTALVTEQCLLNPNRNPRLDRDSITALLGEWLGVDHVIWLGEGLHGDGTDGHIDNLACFARPGLVLLATTEDREDPNFPILADARRRLEAARDAKGRPLDVLALPLPAPKFADGERLIASYVNFYLANGAIIAPAFGDPADQEAADTLAAAFPGRTVVSVPALDILRGGGGIHCITQQQPIAFAAA